MTGPSLALILIAAVFHATWNLFVKNSRDGVAFTWAFSVFALALYLPVTLGVALFTDAGLRASAFGYMAVSGMLQTAYFLLLTRAYRSGDLSLVYPVARGTGPLLATLGGVVLFGERPSIVAFGGVALIVGGVLVLALPARSRTVHVAGSTVAFAVATGVCIAGYTLWDKHAVASVSPVVYNYGITTVIALLLTPVALGTAARRRTLVEELSCNRRSVAVVAALSPLTYILVLAALRLSPVSYIAPAREVSIVVGTLLGARLLKEEEVRRRFAGSVAIVAGVLALALG
ncbi:MAG: EamA family transporter [Dehalococcoidia bacterium]